MMAAQQRRRGWGRNGEWVKPELRKYHGSKEDDFSLDLTFSFGQRVDLRTVNRFLLDNAFNRDITELQGFIDQIHVDRRSVVKEQVKITCLEKGQNDELVKRLESAVQEGIISHCHTMANDEVAVVVDMLHPSIDVQKDFVDVVLAEFGVVKMWFPRRDAWTKIKTGEYVFIMKGCELERKPIPRQIMFNDKVVNVHYSTQPMICYQCGRVGHKAQECDFPFLGSDDGQSLAREKAEKELSEQNKMLDEINKEAASYKETTTGAVAATSGIVEETDPSPVVGDEQLKGSGDAVEKSVVVVPVNEIPQIPAVDIDGGSSVDPSDMELGAEAASLRQNALKKPEDLRKTMLARRAADQDSDGDGSCKNEDWTLVRGRKSRKVLKAQRGRASSLDTLKARSQPVTSSRAVLIKNAQIVSKDVSAIDPLDPMNTLD